MKTKRRFDNLHSVTMQLVHVTRNMDLTSWGEFGRHIEKLQEVLSEDGLERARGSGGG
mgnify:CR=1 FL=1